MSETAAKQTAASAYLSTEVASILSGMGVAPNRYSGGTLVSRSPITGEIIGHVRPTTAAEANAEIDKANTAFLKWRLVPAPKRGELVRLFGEELRANKPTLGRLVSDRKSTRLNSSHMSISYA